MQAFRFFRLAAVVAAIVLVAGCASQSLTPSGPATRTHAEALFQAGQYQAAATTYQRLARSMESSARAALLLKSGQAWAKANRPTKALNVLNAIPAGRLSGDKQTARLLLIARIDVAGQRPQSAVNALDVLTQAQPHLAREHKLVALKLRGQALFAMDQPIAATRTLVTRGNQITAPEEQSANQRLIWHGLTQARQSLKSTRHRPTVAGWLALGRISHTAWQEPYRFRHRIAQWQQRYPHHPANGAFTQRLLTTHAARLVYPDKIALLLPLEGSLATRAIAIRDGLLAAHYAHGTQRTAADTGPQIRIYDTHGNADATVKAYRAAITDGAKLVIGPISQDALEALVNASVLAVPTLALADLPHKPVAQTVHLTDDGTEGFFRRSQQQAHTGAHPLLYQFGFAPTDEARQAARRAVRNGLMRGVMLVPNNNYGKQMIEAFRQQMKALGGRLLAAQRYQTGQSNFSQPIKRMLNLNLSQARARTLDSVLGQKLNFIPRRRQDVQFIFIAADNAQARLIRPQIRFHRGIRLPVYATSTIYAPNSNSQYDLNGVLFMDTPWVLSKNDTVATIRHQLAALWPRYYAKASRYYALGYDAYRLVSLITNDDSLLASPIRGVTGILTMDGEHRIHREYDWAMYKNGQVRVLTTAAGDQ